MGELVTTTDVKRRLNILHADDDVALNDWLAGAEEVILNYLGEQGQSGWYADGEVTGTVPDAVKTAVVMLVGYFYRSPDRDEDGAFGHGTLPWPVTAVLYPLRDPALA